VHSLESEAAVLGALMWGEGAFEHCARLLPEHFHDPVHQALYVELKRRNDASRPVDAASLRDWWRADEARTALDGDTPYLADLMRDVPENDSVQAYADQVREYAERRRLVEIGRALTAQAENTELAPRDALEASERDLASLAETGSTGRKVVSLSMALRDALNSPTQGAPTGWADLDRSFNGWIPEELVIAAGRPGMGKSLFGAGCVLNQAKRGVPSVFISLEMGAGQAAVRFASMLCGVPYRTIKRREMTPEQAHALRSVMDRVDELPITIIDMPGAKVPAIRNALRRLDRDMQRRLGRGLGFVCLDYLGYLEAPSPGMSKNDEVAANSKALKMTARELKLPMLVLCQLNRGVEQRTDKHPMMSDLRDSGAIEQDADAIFGLYRDAYYAEREEPDCHPSEPEYLDWQKRVVSKTLDVDILKNRDGETARVVLYCDPATGQIENYEESAA